MIGGGADLADISGSDDHEIDVLREWAWFTVVAASPGTVDQRAVRAVQPAKLLFQDGFGPMVLSKIEWSSSKIGEVVFARRYAGRFAAWFRAAPLRRAD